MKKKTRNILLALAAAVVLIALAGAGTGYYLLLAPAVPPAEDAIRLH